MKSGGEPTGAADWLAVATRQGTKVRGERPWWRLKSRLKLAGWV